MLQITFAAEFCNFKGTLEDQVWDRLVCEVNDDRIQRRLLSETKLAYKRALEGLEMAAKNVCDLQTSLRMPSQAALSFYDGMSAQA